MIVTVWPARYEPSAVDDENAVIVGAVVSIVTGSAVADVCVSVVPLSVVVAVERNLYVAPPASDAAVHVHDPVEVSAVHAEPVFDQDPVEAFVSLAEDAVATSSCTEAPTGAEPVKRSVWTEVMLSVFEAPESYVEPVESRSGTDTVGSAYRTTTIPEPPEPPAPDSPGMSQYPPPPPPPPEFADPDAPAVAFPPLAVPPEPPPPVPPEPPEVGEPQLD